MQAKYGGDPRAQDKLAEGGQDRMCRCSEYAKNHEASISHAFSTVKLLKEAGIDIIW